MWKMAKDEEQEEMKFKFVKIKTHVLKVHIHCQGCMHKVKKLLRKVEGVYEVRIEVDEHKVTVLGKVDSWRLIEKLAKSGKHAEIWTPPKCNSFRNKTYLNKQPSLMDGFDSVDYKPRDENVPMWEFESYPKTNHRARAKLGENMWGQDDDIVSDMGSDMSGDMESDMSSDMGRMDYNYPGHYAPEQFDSFKNIYAEMPLYEYQYQLPAAMDNMQGPMYNNYYPYQMMYNNYFPYPTMYNNYYPYL
ncbi:hypothetical protein CASFOL_015363 [Castilleja foliolosa]|uniref:HMA domain-containing protein n=1 Tax=Castilleja foliolosa TaxID=1961234 RepID=A0ABD3DDG7_9LAMI